MTHRLLLLFVVHDKCPAVRRAAFAFVMVATAYVCWLLMKYYKVRRGASLARRLPLT